VQLKETELICVTQQLNNAIALEEETAEFMF